MDCSTPGFPVHHQLLEFTQTHVQWDGDAIQPSHPLLSPSPPAFNLSQHQGLFQWVSSSHQVAEVSEFQFQHQSFQWIFRTSQSWNISNIYCFPSPVPASPMHYFVWGLEQPKYYLYFGEEETEMLCKLNILFRSQSKESISKLTE